MSSVLCPASSMVSVVYLYLYLVLVLVLVWVCVGVTFIRLSFICYLLRCVSIIILLFSVFRCASFDSHSLDLLAVVSSY
jgi:hypothetical protein